MVGKLPQAPPGEPPMGGGRPQRTVRLACGGYSDLRVPGTDARALPGPAWAAPIPPGAWGGRLGRGGAACAALSCREEGPERRPLGGEGGRAPRPERGGTGGRSPRAAPRPPCQQTSPTAASGVGGRRVRRAAAAWLRVEHRRAGWRGGVGGLASARADARCFFGVRAICGCCVVSSVINVYVRPSVR